jgi:hypothetical protein
MTVMKIQRDNNLGSTSYTAWFTPLFTTLYKYNRMHLNNMNNYNTVVSLVSDQISDDLIW